MTTTTETHPVPVYRTDYEPPLFTIDTVDLDFELDEHATRVRARLALRRTQPGDGDLELDGRGLELLSIRVDGKPLAADRYAVEAETLTVHGLPQACTLETEVRIDPGANTTLTGLYRSGGNLFTHCEPEGFRRITWFLDRPDVMARYTTTITADPERWPVLLSNGNRVAVETLEDGRRRVRWEDPFPKPSYLFALVAGRLECQPGTFRTMSGREVRLEIWVEPHDLEKCEHALASLQRAMRWDEETFGREYDLDLYMIVAVGDFNAGAMENKGLNLFNSKYVLARPDTATDDEYEAIEGVVAHEYFHNWTGNRVTCRDWFQLTLKEGLTVYRDQRFSEDMTSEAVKRAAVVAALRSRQFPEDAGPMAHPIRPESYVEMDNFYTATVYEKGAEVVRMYQTLLGSDGFRKGMDLYFERHDGHAVTCDDFRAAMADANGRDLAQFEEWYREPGTPRLLAEGHWNEGTYTLTLRQEAPAVVPAGEFRPLHLPVRVGLVGGDGSDLPLALPGEDPSRAPAERVLELKRSEETFVFHGLPSRPVPSLLRGFSAPVELRMERTCEELVFLLAHDSDPFNRWDAGQVLLGEAILDLAADRLAGRPLALDRRIVDALRAVLADPTIDGSFRALVLGLPSERALAPRMTVIDPAALHAARRFVHAELARALRGELLMAYERHRAPGAYSNDRAAIDRRRTKNRALGYLAALELPETIELAREQLEEADNMTDAQAALLCLASVSGPDREEALTAFHERWKHDPLVLDKWFAIQATADLPDMPERVRTLANHPDFQPSNPNRLRALVGAFANDNLAGFHDAGGDGYAFVGEELLAADRRNPAMGAALAKSFLLWRRFEPGRRELMRAELERLRGAGLSRNTGEIVDRALE